MSLSPVPPVIPPPAARQTQGPAISQAQQSDCPACAPPQPSSREGLQEPREGGEASATQTLCPLGTCAPRLLPASTLCPCSEQPRTYMQTCTDTQTQHMQTHMQARRGTHAGTHTQTRRCTHAGTHTCRYIPQACRHSDTSQPSIALLTNFPSLTALGERSPHTHAHTPSTISSAHTHVRDRCPHGPELALQLEPGVLRDFLCCRH